MRILDLKHLVTLKNQGKEGVSVFGLGAIYTYIGTLMLPCLYESDLKVIKKSDLIDLSP